MKSSVRLSAKLIALLALAITKTTFAAIIYTEGESADTTAPFMGYLSDPSSNCYTAVEFTLDQDGTVAALTVQGMYYSTGTAQAESLDSFTVAVFENSETNGVGDLIGSAPLSASLVSRSVMANNPTTASACDSYQYTLNLSSSLFLSAGTYWISIVNDTSSDSDDSWYWLSSTTPPFTGGASLMQSNTTITGNYSATSYPGDVIFSLSDTPFTAVPEPGAIGALLALSSIGFALLRKRRNA